MLNTGSPATKKTGDLSPGKSQIYCAVSQRTIGKALRNTEIQESGDSVEFKTDIAKEL